MGGPDMTWKKSKAVKKPALDPIKAKLAAGLAKLPNPKKVYDEDNSTDTWSSGDSDDSGSDNAEE
jgi:hypothetical protein